MVVLPNVRSPSCGDSGQAQIFSASHSKPSRHVKLSSAIKTLGVYCPAYVTPTRAHRHLSIETQYFAGSLICRDVFYACATAPQGQDPSLPH